MLAVCLAFAKTRVGFAERKKYKQSCLFIYLFISYFLLAAGVLFSLDSLYTRAVESLKLANWWYILVYWGLKIKQYTLDSEYKN